MHQIYSNLTQRSEQTSFPTQLSPITSATSQGDRMIRYTFFNYNRGRTVQKIEVRVQHAVSLLPFSKVMTKLTTLQTNIYDLFFFLF